MAAPGWLARRNAKTSCARNGRPGFWAAGQAFTPTASAMESEVLFMEWKEEAIEKLRRYKAMQTAVKNIPEQICMLEHSAVDLRSASAPKVGSSGNSSSDNGICCKIFTLLVKSV